MRKQVLTLTALSLVVLMSSCATLFGGKVSDYQRTKPKEGEPSRKMRVGAFIADLLLFPPALAVDFGTGAIYKPEGK